MISFVTSVVQWSNAHVIRELVSRNAVFNFWNRFRIILPSKAALTTGRRDGGGGLMVKLPQAPGEVGPKNTQNSLWSGGLRKKVLQELRFGVKTFFVAV
jgi:hypothetical protein